MRQAVPHQEEERRRLLRASRRHIMVCWAAIREESALLIVLVVGTVATLPNPASAQSAHFLSIPAVTDTHACDLLTLEEKVGAVNEECCFGTSNGPGSPCAAGPACTIECATIMLPLLDTCSPLLDAIFDLADGVEDGIASVLDTVYQSCMEIDTTEALAFLGQLQTAVCPRETFDGVAETSVDAAPCEDARAGCDGGIAAGFMTCAADFCPACTMTGQCDRACGYCSGPAPPPPACDDVRDNCEFCRRPSSCAGSHTCVCVCVCVCQVPRELLPGF